MRRITTAIAGLSLAAVLAACGSASSPAPSGPPASPDPNAVVMSATGMKYDQSTVAFPAGKPFAIAFDNTNGSAPHNVEIRDASGQKAFEGEITDGGKTVTYQVPALPAGAITFLCTLHPDMNGTGTAS
jgi:plastocyanin